MAELKGVKKSEKLLFRGEVRVNDIHTRTFHVLTSSWSLAIVKLLGAGSSYAKKSYGKDADCVLVEVKLVDSEVLL